jgi:hypothetical protein
MTLAGIALLLTASAASPGADPLEPSRRGLVECSEPLTAPDGESCEVVTTYRTEANGEIVSEARMTIPLEPATEIILIDAVAIVDGAICGRIAPEVIRNARFERNGVVVNTPELAALKEALIAAMGGLTGKTACGRHLGTTGVFSTEVWIDGKERPEFRGKTKWIAPERASLRPISPE